MTTPAFCTEADVRALLDLEASGTSRFSSGTIGSNIVAAAWWLERATNRIARNESSLEMRFTTNGDNLVFIPGARIGSTVNVTLNGSTLSDGDTYHLIPDAQQTGVATAIQFRAFNTGDAGSRWYLGIPDWFDRNLDSPYWNQSWSGRTGLPNDLVIDTDWGYTDALLPPPWRDANKILAAWKTLRPDALLSGARATDSGIFDLSQFPIEIQSFVASWRVQKQAAGL